MIPSAGFVPAVSNTRHPLNFRIQTEYRNANKCMSYTRQEQIGRKIQHVRLEDHERAESEEIVSSGRGSAERLRRRFVEEGTAALERRPHSNRVPPKLDGEGEAKLTMIACSEPPEGHSSQPPALLGERLVALNVVDGISRETVRRTLKKTI